MTPVDRISALLETFRIRTSLFHTGPLCGTTTFAARPGRGFLHVLRAGEMAVTYVDGAGRVNTRDITEPSLLFYPRPLEHSFHNAPEELSDFACAALDFDGGERHPLVRTLPAVIVVPLREVAGMGPTFDLLFGEIDNVRCGNRLVANRLFEIVLIQLYRWILDHSADLTLPPGLLTGLADERLARTLIAVHEAPGDSWTLTSMGRRANMSRSAFAARFKAVLGQSPGAYLVDWRLTVARERLRAGLPVATVAAELGYANTSAFSRVFTQHVGASPRAWAAAAVTPEVVA